MDSGPGVANGSCISLDGTTWFNTISEATSGSIDGNWNLRAYIETYPPVQYYNVYRTDCANNGPYTSSNTTTIATEQTNMSYIDETWTNLGFGSYKFGVSYVTIEGYESNIIWSNCLDKGVGYTISATASPSQGGIVNGAGLYEQGTTCTLTATANTGYTFVNWTKNGTSVSTNSTYSFAVTESGSYVANFSLNSYTITVEADPAEGGTADGGGTFNHGETCTLTIVPNVHYTFLNWTENGEVVSTDETYSFIVNSNREIIANLDFFDGVDENGANTFVIYPNPVSDKLMIESQEAVNRCDIYTVSGSLVLSEDENSNSFAVEVGDLRAGTYIIRLTTGDKVQTKQFIKK